MGVVFGFAAGFIPGVSAWRIMFLLGAILPIIMIFLVIYVMPETPRWLLINKRELEAKEILNKVYPNGAYGEHVVGPLCNGEYEALII